MAYKFAVKSADERILKIGEHLANLGAKMPDALYILSSLLGEKPSKTASLGLLYPPTPFHDQSET